MLIRRGTDRHYRLGYLLAGFVLLVLLLSAALQALASVGLIYFEAHPGNAPGQVIVRWGTETETDIVGFRVKRSTQPLVQTAMAVTTVPSQGSAATGAEYEFIDDGLTPSMTYYYWLADLLTSGEEQILTQGFMVVAPGTYPGGRRYYLPMMRHSF